MRTLSYLLIAVASCFSVSARAEDTGERFTSYAGFELGTGTLADVQNTLAPSQLVETGQAGEYIASVCYAVSGGVVIPCFVYFDFYLQVIIFRWLHVRIQLFTAQRFHLGIVNGLEQGLSSRWRLYL